MLQGAGVFRGRPNRLGESSNANRCSDIGLGYVGVDGARRDLMPGQGVFDRVDDFVLALGIVAALVGATSKQSTREDGASDDDDTREVSDRGTSD